jgi:hypothetical protein
MSQNEMILEALTHAPITPLRALEQYGCFRLAARIAELREMGHDIETKKIKLDNGKVIAQYALRRTPNVF